MASSRASSRGSSKGNVEDVDQELLDEMIVKDVSDNVSTDPAVGVVSATPEVINEEEEENIETRQEDLLERQQGKQKFLFLVLLFGTF